MRPINGQLTTDQYPLATARHPARTKGETV